MNMTKGKWLAVCITSAVIAISLTAALVITISKQRVSTDKLLKEAYIPISSDAVSQTDYHSPIDFDKLHRVTKDIYAWIEIPSTKINYPILQKERNDSFYLNHDIDGSKKSRGALFTESMYNSTDFEDSVTVIYGHDMKNGSMFGTLQKYSNEKYFKQHSEFKIYLCDQTRTYKVFAALPFSNKHILCSWNFALDGQMDNFLRSIYSTKSLLANIDMDIKVDKDSKIVILSTCLKSNSSKRFLVMGVLTDVKK